MLMRLDNPINFQTNKNFKTEKHATNKESIMHDLPLPRKPPASPRHVPEVWRVQHVRHAEGGRADHHVCARARHRRARAAAAQDRAARHAQHWGAVVFRC